MVTPTALNGAGCAAAVPAVSAKASDKATDILVFTDASLLSWIGTPSPYSTISPPRSFRRPAGSYRSDGLQRTRPRRGILNPIAETVVRESRRHLPTCFPAGAREEFLGR